MELSRAPLLKKKTSHVILAADGQGPRLSSCHAVFAWHFPCLWRTPVFRFWREKIAAEAVKGVRLTPETFRLGR